jgi:hypothetical protein
MGEWIMQPIAEINAALLEDEASWDGAIEPLQIRDVVSRRVHRLNIDHKLWGALGEGNVHDREGSDVVVHIVKHTEKTIGSHAMLDNVDTYGSLVAVVESGSSDTRTRGPFVEDYTKKGTISSTKMESDLAAAVAAMEPGTENLIPDSYVQLGSTGFFY